MKYPFARLFGGGKSPRRKDHVDPDLGRMTFSSERWWETELAADNSKFRLKIAGDRAPSPALLIHARRLARDLPAFLNTLANFLKVERARQKVDEADISALRISEVVFFDPEKPDYAKVFFAGPSKDRLWHCDVIAGKPQGLTSDW